MATVCLVSAASSRAGRRSVVRIIRSIRPAMTEVNRQKPPRCRPPPTERYCFGGGARTACAAPQVARSPPFAMGCAASKKVDPTQLDPAQIQRRKTKVGAGARDTAAAAARATLQFEQFTPMLVMPFRVFRAQRRIMKSTKKWRDEALKNDDLIVYEDGSSKIVIFISHTWWDRDFKDETNDPSDVYDHGAPDHQSRREEGPQVADHLRRCATPD